LSRVTRRTPSGRIVYQFKKKKPQKARCGVCGKILKGVVCGRPYMVQKHSKTERRPERPFGGVLCSACMRRVMIAKCRKQPEKA